MCDLEKTASMMEKMVEKGEAVALPNAKQLQMAKLIIRHYWHIHFITVQVLQHDFFVVFGKHLMQKSIDKCFEKQM